MLLERDLVGQGASSRAVGVVRAQGGTPATVAPGWWSIDVTELGLDRFDVEGRSRLIDPIALPFPATFDDEG